MNSKENWHPEIEKWEKTIKESLYFFKIMMEEIKEMEKKPLTMMINGCSHKYTGWIENEFICGDWYCTEKRNYKEK